MKAFLLTAGAFVCVLTTQASAQSSTETQKPMNPKAAVQPQPKLAGQQNPGPLVTAQPAGSVNLLVASGSDTCTTPTPISGSGPFAFDTSLFTTGAEGQGNANCVFAGQIGIANDGWYAWTSGAAGIAEIRFCGTSTGDSKIAVYSGSGCPGAAAIACNDDYCAFQSRLTFTAAASTVYTIQVGKYPTSASVPAGTFAVNMLPPPASNNNCSAAIAVSGPGPHAFNTDGATTDGPSNCGMFTNDVWFNWTAGASISYDVSLCAGAVYDSEVSVYDTSACLGALLACDDDFCAVYGPSRATFTAVAGSVYKIQIGGYNGATGSGTFRVDPTLPPPANDDCSTPTVLVGAGPYPFNNSNATTGSQGQNEGLCLAYATTGIENDIWFRWTAGATGQARLTTCSLTGVDTKIAVYPGTGCPSVAAIGCNDDACLPTYQSTVCFSVTNGQIYTIQFGTYPTAPGGTGTFSISIQTGGNVCQVDDGGSEDLLGYMVGGELAWIQRFGPAAGTTDLTNVKISWGSPAAPGFCPGNGTASKVLLYDDPNDDGDPIDAVLVQQINTTVTNVDTDTFNTYPVTPVTLNGYFFVGAGLIHSAGQLVAPMDTSCIQPTLSYFFGNNTGGAVNYTTPLMNPDPPQSFDSSGNPCNLMVRAGCTSNPMVAICLPGQGGIIPCPCANPPAGGGLGCNNFGAGPAASGTLTASGIASLASDTILLTATGENNTSTSVFWAGKPPVHSTGISHGAGVRCITQALKRLYNHPASGGTVSAPVGADISVSARSAAVGSPITAGETRYYFMIYRDPQAAGPCGNSSSTVNLTNGGGITWSL